MSDGSGQIVEHFFRHEYGRLVAQLAAKVGVRHVEFVEDAVQGALASALSRWIVDGIPRDPGAWLYRVACNQLVGTLRQDATRHRILELARDPVAEDDPPAVAFLASEVRDDLLRMLFICCDDAIPRESRLVLALKILCGFSTGEIALGLFTTEANVHKRLQRGRDTLRAVTTELSPPLDAQHARLPSVLEVLYLLFNEGYLSASGETAIRRDLCDEAIRLATLLAGHPVGAVPEARALVALMHLHAARLAARIDATGGLVLLEDQDRTRYDRKHMRLGAEWLARSATRSRAITPRPASPPSTASRRRSRRRAGRRSSSSTRCSIASRRRRCTR